MYTINIKKNTSIYHQLTLDNNDISNLFYKEILNDISYMCISVGIEKIMILMDIFNTLTITITKIEDIKTISF